jgi:sugar phosphate isomerase/epimerase
MDQITRRGFLGAGGALAVTPGLLAAAQSRGMKFGLVTYQWARDMDLGTLIAACEKTGLLGVELRTGQAHGVEPALSGARRSEVRKRFADSPVELVGYGSNCEFHDADPALVRKNIELAKQYVLLMQDCGGQGVKVKPNGFPPGVPHEKTIEQIGRALNEVSAFGADHGQKIRLEVHGRETCELPVIRAICQVASHRNLYVCWNCNDEDLHGAGLEANFAMVQSRIGDTTHVRELDVPDYPYQELFRLFAGIGYSGWFLLEAQKAVPDRIQAMAAQRRLFQGLVPVTR